MWCKVLTVGLVAPFVLVPLEAAAAAPSPAAAEPTCRGVPATIVGSAGDDRIVGTRGPDVIAGMRGDDRILGLSGDDVLCGNAGADDLLGGRGHDRMYGGRDRYEQRTRRSRQFGDRLEGGPGDDHLSVGFDDEPRGRVEIWRSNSVDFRHSTRPVTVTLSARTATGEGSDVIVPGRNLQVDGTRFDDVIHGSDRRETLDGGRGDDQVFGGGGTDAVLGYRGDDLLHGGQGDDLVVSTAGTSTVEGGDGGDWLLAAGGATTTLLGGAGSDYLARHITPGETGVVDGGEDEDQLELYLQLWWERDPSATLDAETGTAVVTAGSDTHTTNFTSIDFFTLWGPRWTFRGTEADDFVQVLDGRLHAHGFGGDDFLLGSDRADVLDGGDDTDEAWGGKGRNTCIDTESGDCDAYPWDSAGTRARVLPRHATSLALVAPHKLVSRWLNHRTPFPVD